VPKIAKMNLRLLGHAPVLRAGCAERASSAAVPSGAAMIPASTSAASMSPPSHLKPLPDPTSADDYPQFSHS
jgi:hypothetical protein